MGKIWVAIWAALTAFALWNLHAQGNLPSATPVESLSDVAADKYVAAETVAGGDPYQPIRELSDAAMWPAPHPRPPAALLLLTPLVLIPDGWLLASTAPLLVGVMAICMYAACRIGGLDERWGLAALVALVPIGVFQQVVGSGTPTAGFVALIAAGWMLARERPMTGGVLIGLAAGLKMWPLLVVVVLLAGRRTRTVGIAAAGTASLITLLGLALPAISLAGTASALAEAGSFFHGLATNTSFTQLGLVGVTIGFTTLTIAFIHDDLNWRMGVSIMAGLMLSPLTWGYYWLAAAPFAVLLGRAALVSRKSESPIRLLTERGWPILWTKADREGSPAAE